MPAKQSLPIVPVGLAAAVTQPLPTRFALVDSVTWPAPEIEATVNRDEPDPDRRQQTQLFFARIEELGEHMRVEPGAVEDGRADEQRRRNQDDERVDRQDLWFSSFAHALSLPPVECLTSGKWCSRPNDP